MAIFNSKLLVYQRVHQISWAAEHDLARRSCRVQRVPAANARPARTSEIVRRGGFVGGFKCWVKRWLKNTLWWTNSLLWKITIFNWKIHYKWPFSIAMLVHQRVPGFGFCRWFGLFSQWEITTGESIGNIVFTSLLSLSKSKNMVK